MPYQAKTDWKYNDPVTEVDVNRWEQGIKDAHAAMDNFVLRLASLETRVKTLEDAVLNDFKNNIFNISFQTLDGVIVSSGWHDVANGRLVVK
jgi:hypothetical protein